MSDMGYLSPPRGSPAQTAAARSGVYPMNQTAALPVVVPVLPAAGRPRDILAPERPGSGPSMTPARTCDTASATPRSMACAQSVGGTGRDVPFRSTTEVMALGLQWTPRAAKVA